MLQNTEIRSAAKAAGIPLWAVADALNISEPTMTRRLRRELPEREKQKLLQIIRRLQKENAAR